MKIAPDPKAWKPWRRAVRLRVKADPALRRARKRAPVRSAAAGSLAALRFVVPVAVGVLAHQETSLVLLAGGLLLWTLLVTLMRAQQTAGALHSPGELWLFYGWPLSDEEVLAHQRALILRASLWLGVDWLVFGLAVALRQDSPALIAAAPLLAAGQWAAALALGLHLGARLPRLPYGWAAAALGVLLFLLARFAEAPPLAACAPALWQALATATPGGWLFHAWMLLHDGQPAGWPALGALAGCSVAALALGARAARAAFHPEKIFDYETPGHEPPAPAAAPPPADPARVRAAALAALEAPPGRVLAARGPVERSLLGFLTPRERTVVDFMQPGGHPWLRRWAAAASLVILAGVLRDHSPGIALLPALLGMALALPVTGGRWSGFDALALFQTQIGAHAYVPLGFGEIVRPLLKLNALHCLLALPLVIAAMGLGFAPANAPFAWGLDYGLRVVAAVLAVQPLCLIGKYSANTNDSSSGKLFLAFLVVGVIGGFFASLGLGIALFAVDTPAAALPVAAGLLALTHSLLALYGWVCGRGWFDQMARVR